MSLSTKILIAISAMVAICAAGFIIYKQIEISNRQMVIERSMVTQKQLEDNITRSMGQYASKEDIEKYIKENGLAIEAIKDDLKTLGAEIKLINRIIVISNGQQGNNIPSTNTGPNNPNPPDTSCKECDRFGYLSEQQNLRLDESFPNTKVPIGTVGFSAWQEKPWSIDIRPREYRVTNVVGTDDNQRHYVYNKFSVVVDGKPYDVKIDKAEMVEEYPEPSFHWWNPRLFVGTDSGVNLSNMNGELTPNINIGVMSYGMYKNQPDFSFLQVGVGYGAISRRAQLVVTPVVYNVGKHLPLMNNMYVGPSVHISSNAEFSVMGGFRTAW